MNETANNNRELIGLLSALVDDVINDQQFARLDQILSNEAQARQFFIQYLDLHNELAEGDALAGLPNEEPSRSAAIAGVSEPIPAANTAPAQAKAADKDDAPFKNTVATAPTVASAAGPRSTKKVTKEKAAPLSGAAAKEPNGDAIRDKRPDRSPAAGVVAPPAPPPRDAARGDRAKPQRPPSKAPPVATAPSAINAKTAPTPPAPPIEPAAIAPATRVAAAEAAAEAASDLDEDESPRSQRRWRMRVPAWLVSAVVHAIAIVVLGGVPLAMQEMKEDISIVSNIDTDSEPVEIAEFDIVPDELEVLEMTAMTMPDPGVMDFGDLGLESDLAEATDGIGMLDDSPFGEVGELFGEEGLGMSEIGEGMGAAMFFGVKVTGSRFCYVVDNSNSMNGGRFETAVHELVKSVRQLEKHHYFYVIFYSDTAYPLFYPETATGWVQATDKNKRMLEYWLMMVQRCLRTCGEEAMELAFSMNPDAIYLLGDGAFSDKTVEKTLATEESHVTIHTLGFGVKGRGLDDFQKIAKQFNGTFTDVQVTPAMVELSKRINRPKNSKRNGAWGIKLGR